MAKFFNTLHVTKLHTEIVTVAGIGTVRQVALTAENIELLGALNNPSRVAGLQRRISNEALRPDSDDLLRCMPVEVTLRGYVAAANVLGEKLIQAAKNMETHAGASLTEWQNYLQKIGFVEHGFDDHHSYAISQLGGRCEARYLTNGNPTEGRVNAIGFWITGYGHSLESWREVLIKGAVQRSETTPHQGQPDPVDMAQQYMLKHYNLAEPVLGQAKTTTALPGSLTQPRPTSPFANLLPVVTIKANCGTSMLEFGAFAPNGPGMTSTAEMLGLVPTNQR